VTRRSWAWSLVVIGLALVVAGWVVMSFLTEPSAVGRMRTGLIAIGAGSIVVGAIGGVAGVWMLIDHRT
jgi:uncharacterized membrane protein